MGGRYMYVSTCMNLRLEIVSVQLAGLIPSQTLHQLIGRQVLNDYGRDCLSIRCHEDGPNAYTEADNNYAGDM